MPRKRRTAPNSLAFSSPPAGQKLLEQFPLCIHVENSLPCDGIHGGQCIARQNHCHIKLTLMAGAGREHGWTLIAEQEKKVNGKTIRPDGTFKDAMNLVRGYWEAKDTDDDLEAEIEKKRQGGVSAEQHDRPNTATAENLAHAVALRFIHDNFCRIHQTLRVTPAIEA